MSGTSNKTLESANTFAQYNLMMLSDFMNSPNTYLNHNEKRMVCLAIIIRDSFHEAENIVNSIEHPHQKDWTLYGTENDIINKLKDIKNIGATDIMIRVHRNDKEIDRIHNMILKINKGEITI
jgi:hypothetical protein